jgi:hypothetical protein
MKAEGDFKGDIEILIWFTNLLCTPSGGGQSC